MPFDRATVLKFEQIKELIKLVATHNLGGLELERSGFHLKIDGGRVAGSHAATGPQASSAPAAVAAPGGETVAALVPSVAPETSVESAETPAVDELPENAYVMKSPFVGTFYRSPRPEAAPFVKDDDQVVQGQVLCIVEAMKLMNEIESEIGGKILEIYPQDGQMVEYDEPLFVIQPG